MNTHTEQYSAIVQITGSRVNIQLSFWGNVGPSINYLAASPATRGMSFTGSGLPYPSQDVAFQNSSKGNVELDINKKCMIDVNIPNSYYSATMEIVPPTLWIWFTKDGKKMISSIKLCDSIQFRSLTYPTQRTSAMFYNNILPIQSQDKILLASAYGKNLIPSIDFWADKPST
jgi:hypothetical protein